MAKALFLESVAGVAGDMFASAFVDAGLVSSDELRELPSRLGLTGVEIEFENVIRASIRATHLKIKLTDDGWKEGLGDRHHHHDAHNDAHHDDSSNLLLGEDAARHWHSHYRDIDALIKRSSLDEAVRHLACEIFRVLAEAEADAHGIEVEKVAFHEVGTVDSVLDVVMAAYCVVRSGAEFMFATPIKPGRGFVKMRHGTHAVPPPASVRLLVGLPVAATPDAISRENVELSTPTGIAILKVLKPNFVHEFPAGTLLHQGSGAGTMDLGDFPNIFRVSMLDIETETPVLDLPYEHDTVVEIICNIDDDTGEHLAWMAEQLLKLGALDVWQTPAVGKKGRVSVCFSLLADERSFSGLADWVLRNSTTFGLRYRKLERLKLARHFETRETPEGPVKYKIGSTVHGEKLKEKAEFDDLMAAKNA